MKHSVVTDERSPLITSNLVISHKPHANQLFLLFRALFTSQEGFEDDPILGQEVLEKVSK